MVAIPSALNKPGDMIALTDKLPIESPISCRLRIRQVAGRNLDILPIACLKKLILML